MLRFSEMFQSIMLFTSRSVSDRMSKVAAAPRRAAVHTKARHRGCSPMPRPDSRQTARGSHNVEGWTPPNPLLSVGNILPISHNDRENPPFVWLSSACWCVLPAWYFYVHLCHGDRLSLIISWHRAMYLYQEINSYLQLVAKVLLFSTK